LRYLFDLADLATVVAFLSLAAREALSIVAKKKQAPQRH
jgi:hypothetical protein